METIAQKNARLRAHREDRDGTPEVISAQRSAAYVAAKARIDDAHTNVMTGLFDVMRDDPDAIMRNLGKVDKIFKTMNSQSARVARMPKR
jgi:hypothetical protein